MERSVRVNAGSGSSGDPGPPSDNRWPSVNIHGQRAPEPMLHPDPDAGSAFEGPAGKEPTRRPNTMTRAGTAADQGPCLYFGPAGQRCERRATRDGFCARHQAGASAVRVPILTPKRIAAFLVAIAMLWPELVRIVSALLRLLR